jgi:secreted trypsin-like serine protease
VAPASPLGSARRSGGNESGEPIGRCEATSQRTTGPVEVGTVSYGGSLCGLPGAPTVYSWVSATLGFINGV